MARPRKSSNPLPYFVASTAIAGVSAIVLWVAVDTVTRAASLGPLPAAPVTPVQALVLLALAEVLVVAVVLLAPHVLRAIWRLSAHAAHGTWTHARTRMHLPALPALPKRAEAPWKAEEAHAAAPAPQPTSPADPVAQRIGSALTGLVFGDARADTPLTVARIHPTTVAGAHRQVRIDYPPRASARIHDQVPAITALMARAFPPVGDEWHAIPDAEHDRLVLVDRPDPLNRDIPTPQLPADVDLHAGIPIAQREDGTWWSMPLMGGFHWFVVGSSGAGKGSWLGGVVAALEPLIADGRVRLWIADPKGGAEFSWARSFAHRFAITPAAITEMLEEAAKVMAGKSTVLGESDDFDAAITVPTRGTPLDLVIVDELAHVVAYGSDSKLVARAESALNTLLSQGRAPAFTVLAAAQDPRKKVTDMRELFTGTVLLRVKKASDVTTILGSGARADGALADLIPESLKGAAFVTADGQAGWQRVRTPGLFADRRRALSKRLGAALRAPAVEPLHLDAHEPASAQPARMRAAAEAHGPEQQERPVRAARAQPVRATGSAAAPVRVDALALPARAHLEDGAQPVVILDVEPDPTEEGRVLVTWHPEGHPERTRCLSMETDDRVRLA